MPRCNVHCQFDIDVKSRKHFVHLCSPVPDLAIVTFGKTIQQAKRVAIEAIKIHLEAYQEVGKTVPGRKPIEPE